MVGDWELKTQTVLLVAVLVEVVRQDALTAQRVELVAQVLAELFLLRSFSNEKSTNI